MTVGGRRWRRKRRATRPIAWLVLVASSVLSTASCGGEEPSVPSASTAPPSGPPLHVLVVSVDTLRADYLGCYGSSRELTPAIDALAREGTLFDTVATPRGQTWPALMTLLSGLYPRTHGVRSNGSMPPDDVKLVSHHLREAGYATAAFLANFDDAMEPADARGFDLLVKGTDDGSIYQAEQDRALTRRALEWIESHSDQPTFTWVHFMDPHRPYNPSKTDAELLGTYDGWLSQPHSVRGLEDEVAKGRIGIDREGLERFLATRPSRPKRFRSYRELIDTYGVIDFDRMLDMIALEKISLSAEDLEYVRARYATQVRSTDRNVRRLMRGLARIGLTEATLVVFTSDHGDELYDHNHYFFHGSSIYEGVVRLPLIFRWPGVVPSDLRIDHVVELLDVMPTILDLCGIELDEEARAIEGTSLAPLFGGGASAADGLAFVEVFHGGGDRNDPPPPPLDAAYAVRDARWKLVQNASGLAIRTVPYTFRADRGFLIDVEALFDLDADPAEQVNLLDESARRTALESRGSSVRESAQALLEMGRAQRRLRSKLAAWIDSGASTVTLDTNVTPEVLEHLADLGYVDAESVPLPTGSTRGETGNPEAAGVGFARDVLLLIGESNEEDAGLELARAEAHFWLGELDEAERALQRALNQAPAARRDDVEARARELHEEFR